MSLFAATTLATGTLLIAHLNDMKIKKLEKRNEELKRIKYLKQLSPTHGYVAQSSNLYN